MKLTKYIHKNADKIVPEYILYPLYFELQKINFSNRKKGTKNFRNNISQILLSQGWSKPVRVTAESQIKITSLCKKTGLCFQFGNMARLYADMLKLQLMYQKGTIRSAIYLVPMKKYALSLGSNLANFERFTSELRIFRQIINVPLIVIGIEEE
jgi:hypothetical protein